MTPRFGSVVIAAAALVARASLPRAAFLRPEPGALLALLLAGVLVVRAWTARGPHGARTTALLGGLLLLDVCGMSDAPVLLACWLAFALALPVALAPGPLPLSAIAALSVATTGVAALLFVAIPRLPHRAAPEATTGFAPSVGLDAFALLADDPSVVLRGTSTPPLEGRIYWRGLALDTFDGRRWMASSPATPAFPQLTGDPPPGSRTLVISSRDPTGVLFLPGRPFAIEASPGQLAADAGDGWRILPAGPARYTAEVEPEPVLGDARFPPELDPARLGTALALPRGIDPRIVTLADRVAGGGPAAEQVDRLATWLRTEMVYERRPIPYGDALASFLLDVRAGHCELFATSLAVLARARGIPSRLVTGFAALAAPGEPIEVRRSSAHAWVEIHDPSRGWIAFDPTPVAAAPVSVPVTAADRLQAGWRRGVVDWSRDDQRATLAAGAALAKTAWPIAVLTAVTLIAFAVVRSRRGSAGAARRARALWVRRGRIGRLHAQARDAVRRAGWEIPASLPPVSAAHWLAERAPGPAADALHALAWLTYEVELGGEPAEPRVAAAAELLERVRNVRPAVLRRAS